MTARRTSLLTCVMLCGCFKPTGSEDTTELPTTAGASTSSDVGTTSVASGASTEATSGGPTEATLSTTSTTGAPTTMSTTGTGDGVCGDGQLDEGEECDDGGAEEGCSDSCTKEFRRVFVTSMVFTGNLGGLAGADQKCQDAAKQAGLPGVYKAWLSSSTESPSDPQRFVHSTVPYQQVDGTVVANDWDDLIDSNLMAGIVVSELNGPAGKGLHSCVPIEIPVWTNTSELGAAVFSDKHCGTWESSSGTAMVGRAGDTTFQWTVACEVNCSDEAGLYCFEQ